GQWLPLFINTVLQSLFVLAAAAIVLICSPKASAARRHLVSLAALGALLLIPLVTWMFPAPKPLLQVSAPGLDLRQSPIRALSAPIRMERGGVTGGDEPVSHPGLSRRQGSASSFAGGFVSAATTPPTRSQPVSSIAFARFSPGLAVLWLTGVLLGWVRLLIGFDRIRRIKRDSQAALPTPLQMQIGDILAEVGFTRPLTIRQASSRNPVSVPMTWGVRPATLLLPMDAEEWPRERLRVVLLHEVGHIRRHDWLTQMLGQAVCALYWFHPLVWMLHRHAQIEAERACDDTVLLVGVRAKEYATHLLDVVKAIQTGREAPVAAVAMARPTQVRYRLQSILNARRSRRAAPRSLQTLVLLTTALLLCVVSRLRPFAWANARKSATNLRQITAIGSVVRLPNGISVELDAIGGRANPHRNHWWKPDGKLLSGPPKEFVRSAHLKDREPGTHLRMLVFHTTSPIPLYCTWTSRCTQAKFGNQDILNGDENHVSKEQSISAGLYQDFPQHLPSATLQIGIAVAPWKTVAVIPMPKDAPPISGQEESNQGSLRLVLPNYPKQGELSTLRYTSGINKPFEFPFQMCDAADLPNVARRLVAVDREGNTLPLRSNYAFHPNRNQLGTTFLGVAGYQVRKDLIELLFFASADASAYPGDSHIDFTKIREFRLQVRPYDWANFRDIALQPATRSGGR
ncbi:MAG: antirepressor regulating drug resistance protein, partial [Chthonomonadales bacterium]|nr:antirepressor regulating drug resistance protein [Chthonomonadales bacterium]